MMRNRRDQTRRIFLWSLFALLPSCGPLLPGSGGRDAAPITYRTLTLEDFKARRVPERFRAHGQSVGAALCGQIVITDDSGFSAQRLLHEDGSHSFRVRIRHLAYRGEVQPGCSWWNPQLPARDIHRVLQHEQIHFALIEIATRKLNAQAADLMAAFEAVAESRELAEAAAADTIEAMTAMALGELQSRHEQFDVESRHHVLPEHQQYRWWQNVQAELAATAPPQAD